MNTANLTEKKNSQLWVEVLTVDERKLVLQASKECGLRKSAFYKQAILEKAQSVLSSSSNNKTHKEASTAIELVDGASFLSGGEK